MSVKILSPSNLPTIRSHSGAVYVRVAKNTIHLSTALCGEMDLGVGGKICFLIKDGRLYVYKASGDDAYVLRGKRNDKYFSYASLSQAILAHYNCTGILEKGIANSVKFDVVKKTLPFIVAGVEIYWEIIPPKKLEKT